MSKTDLERLNEQALQSFEQIRAKVFSGVLPAIRSDNKLKQEIIDAPNRIIVNKERIEQIANNVQAQGIPDEEEVENRIVAGAKTEAVLTAISSFELTPNLSIAMADIVASKYSNREENLLKAIRRIEDELK